MRRPRATPGSTIWGTFWGTIWGTTWGHDLGRSAEIAPFAIARNLRDIAPRAARLEPQPARATDAPPGQTNDRAAVKGERR